MLLTSTSTSSPAFTVSNAVLSELGRVNDAFRLVAKIDDDAALAYADNGAANDFAFFEGRLFLLKLIEELTKVDVAGARLVGLIGFICAWCGCWCWLRSHNVLLRRSLWTRRRVGYCCPRCCSAWVVH